MVGDFNLAQPDYAYQEYSFQQDANPAVTQPQPNNDFNLARKFAVNDPQYNTAPTIKNPDLLNGVEQAGMVSMQEMRIDPSAEAFGGLMGAVTNLSRDVSDAVSPRDVAAQQPVLEQPTHNIPTLENNTWTPSPPGMMS